MTDWAARVLAEVDAAAAATERALADLVATPSIGGTDAEHDIQADLARQLDQAGLDVDHWRLPLDTLMAEPDFPGVEVERTEAWGLVGRLPGRGDGPSVMLDGHIDVVPTGDLARWSSPDPFSGRVVDGELFGRGACDMKAGVASAIAAVTAVRRSGVPLRGDLLIACVAGEEDGGLGTYATLRRGWRADACVIPEPTSLDLLVANAGALTFRLRIAGKATHASRRSEGVSAVDKLVPVLAALTRLETARNRDVDPLMASWALPYPISIGRVQSGDWASSVPDLLVAEGRLGVALGEPVEHARSALEEAIASAGDDDPWLRAHPVTVQWWGGQFAPGRLAADSDLAARMSAAHIAASRGSMPASAAATGVALSAAAAGTGRVPRQLGAPYGSDLRLLQGAGMPTLQYGPGDAVHAHAPDERVPLVEVHTASRALALLALDICGIA